MRALVIASVLIRAEAATNTHKRESAKDKRRNEPREFALKGVSAQRANHEGDQCGCSRAPIPGN
jgi:hypothetical protein